MDWITYKRSGMFWGLFAVQGDGHLSSQLANASEIDFAADELKRQIDVAANRLKLELQRAPAPLHLGKSDA